MGAPADHPDESTVRVLVLGPPAVADATGVSGLAGQQGQVLSHLVAAHPNVVSSDTLIDELWPDRAPRSARTGLRVVMTRLRSRLDAGGGAGIVHDGSGYRLDLDDDRIDAVRFERLVGEAEAGLESDPADSADRARRALDLWRGEAYQPFGRHGGLAVAAGPLEERRRQAEELLVDALLRSGRAESAATWATGLVETEPYRERRWEQLMLALYRAGRQAEAVRTGQRAAATLRDELGIDPGPGLRALESDILNQAPELDAPPGQTERSTAAPGRPAPADDAAVAAGPPPLRATPVPRNDDSFRGRSADEDRLAAALERSRLVTVVGGPGVGKTRLAARHAAGLPDGTVAWLDLVSFPADRLAVELLGVLGVRQGDRSPGEALAAAMTGRRLLVLDNAEHVPEVVADLVESSLAADPTIRILVTSRLALASPSEARLDLGPLPVEHGVRLLAERAFGHPMADEREQLAALVRQLDGSPLAIELAAPLLQVTSPLALRERLEATLEPAEGRGRPDERHRSIRSAIDWSIDLLGGDDRELFDSIAVLPGGFTGRDAADVVGRPIDVVEPALARLAAGGLLRSVTESDGRQRWRQLNTVRTHARSRLRERGRLDDLERAQAARHVALVERLGPDLLGPAEDVAVDRLGRSFDQLRATHARLIADAEVEAASTFGLGMWEYNFFRQHYQHYHWLDEVLELPGIERVADHDELLAQAALAGWARDRFPAALALAAAAEAAADGRDRPVPLTALKTRVNIAAQEGRLDEAAARLDELSVAADERGTDRDRADVLVSVAMGLAQVGAAREAGAAADRSLALATASGNPTSVSWAMVGLGSSQTIAEPRLAARSFSAASRLARSVRNHWVDGMALTGLATALRYDGRPDAAAQLLVDVVGRWDRSRNVAQLWRCCQEAVLVLEDRGRADATGELVARLGLADRLHPMPPDDWARIDELTRRSPLSVGPGPASDDDGNPGDGSGPGVAADPLAGLAGAVILALASDPIEPRS